MGLDTDFNQAPYYDDFDENKNFHRVLFKPGVALQARELTQLQSILQNQVERFGNNILVEGTIIDGCNFNEIRDLEYIKILDLNTNGQPLVLNNYVDTFVYGQSTGIKARVQAVSEGLESDGTNLKTIYVKYLTSGTNTDIKTFSTSENLIITNVSTNNIIDTVTAAGNVLVNPTIAVGKSYAVKVSDGIIYQKGFFINVDEQLAIVSKYSNLPDSLVVGFTTAESIVNSNVDTSLLDNANGFNNYQAPGADRLKLIPSLKVMTTAEADADDKFFSIQEYKNGRVVRRNNSTQYNVIMDMIEKRTKDESGNYTVSDFNISVSNNNIVDTMNADQIVPDSSYTIVSAGNTNFTAIGALSNAVGTIFIANSTGTGSGSVRSNTLDLNMGAGLAYVEGKRVELLNKYNINLPKATTSTTVKSQNITTNYGSYVFVREYMGKFDFHKASTIYFYDQVQASATANSVTVAGNNIGQASISSIILESGTPGNATAVYRMYLFNVKMNTGKNQKDIRSIVASGNTGTADLVGSGSTYDTTIYDVSFKSRIFKTGASALKSLPATGSNASYISRTSTTFNITANSATIPTPSGAIWPYTVGSSLNNTQKKDLILIAGANTGSYVKDKPIDLSSANVYVTNSTSMSISTFSSASIANNTLYFNVRYNAISAPTQQTLETVYVKINCANNGTGNTVNTTGPWSLGIPNVYAIDDVWVNTTANTNSTTTSKKSYFVLNTNQQSDFYGLSTLRVKPGSGISNTSVLLVKLRALKSNTSAGFYSVSSYPLDDISTANTAALTTDAIPTFKDNKNVTYALRDSIDFRPYAVNTAVYSANAASATVNPSIDFNFYSSTDLKIPAPNEALVTDYDYYLGRKDLLFINEYGDFALKQGVPSDMPKLPSESSVGMVLADLVIPPYPSLDVGISLRNNRRYTMQDVNDIDQRLQTVEYYTALNLLESKTKDLIVSDGAGNNRFKNGIFVDDFQDSARLNLIDPSWSATLNDQKNEISPYFTAHPLLLKLDTGATSSNVKTYRDVITLSKTAVDQTLLSQNVATNTKFTTTVTTVTNGKMEIYPAVSYGAMLRRFSSGNSIFYAMPGMVNIRVTGLKANSKYYVKLNNLFVVATPASYSTINTTQQIEQLSFGYGNRSVPSKYFNTHWSEEAPEVFPGQNGHSDYRPSDYYIYSDANGTLLAQFQVFQYRLPLGTHTVSISDGVTQVCSVQYKVLNVAAETPVIGSSTFVSSTVTQNVSYGQALDHLSQTFKIDTNVGLDSVIFLDKLDLYFAGKPASSTGLGATIEIMATNNGKPDPTKTLCSVYLPNSSINVDVNGNIVTTVDLTNPIALKTNAIYALTIIADQHNPDFKMSIAKIGDVNKATNKVLAAGFSTFEGELYSGSSGSQLTAVAGEKLKFTLYNAAYNKSGYAYLTNRDHEFFTVADYNTIKPDYVYLDVEPLEFIAGETIAKLNANLTSFGTLSVNASSYKAIASSNSVAGKFVAGDYIGYWTVDASGNNVIDTVKINNVALTSSNTATEFTLESYPMYTNTAAQFFQTIVGNVSYHNEESNVLHLIDSSAHYGNTGGVTTWFTPGDALVGVQSGTTATILSVDDMAIGAIDANISETNYTLTSSNYTTQILKTNGDYQTVATDEEFTLLNVNDPKASVVIPSTSHEYSNNLGQGFRLKVDLKNTGSAPYESTPAVDIKNSNVYIWEYAINNDATDEAGLNSQLGGNALSRYISSTVSLAENLDAEDIVVYLTAYKPPSSNLKTYIRFKNNNDNRNFYDIEWTELVAKDNPVSSSTNLNDYREIEYRMSTVANSSALTNGNGAALDLSNNNVLTYKDLDGAIYTGYRDFAIKVVFLTSDKKSIPRIKNIRSIALT